MSIDTSDKPYQQIGTDQHARVNGEKKRFFTRNQYSSRETKPHYVMDKYSPILGGSVLDVGADGKHLKPFVEQEGGSYLGIGFGDKVDMEIDLESGSLPFEDDQFDTVLCLDVLEHLESAHFMLAELCRVSRNSVIISLPNPYNNFFNMLRCGDYSKGARLKFYGLPSEAPVDRHRWFFSEAEAKEFLAKGFEKAGFSVAQVDALGDDRPLGGHGIRGILGRWLLRIIFRSDIESLGLNHGTLWCVGQKRLGKKD